MNFRPGEKEKALRAIAYLRHNPVIFKAAKHAGISVDRLRTIRKSYPKFSEMFEDALAEGKVTRVEKLHAEAYRRAVEGVQKNVYHMGKVVGTETIYSDSLLGKLLTGWDDDFKTSKVESKSEVLTTEETYEDRLKRLLGGKNGDS